MCTIGVETRSKRSGTLIPDLFIDRYMTRLDGFYIRVYLYLVRHYFGSNPDRRDCTDFSIETMADFLGCMETDAHRALRGLADEGLLSVTLDSKKRVTGIKLVDLFETSASDARDLQASQNLQDYRETPARTAGGRCPTTNDLSRSIVAAPAESYPDKSEETPDYKTMEKAFAVTNDCINRFSKDPAYEGLTVGLEGILQGPLAGEWFRLMLFAYEELHFSKDLIYYLFEYCIEIGKRDARYMTKVAIGWAEHGISTEEEAKLHVMEFDEIARAVREQFGMNRQFGRIQLDFLLRWGREWQTPVELVAEACKRTILNTSKPDFRYANTILKQWHELGLKTLRDIETADSARSRSGAAAKDGSSGKCDPAKKSDSSRGNRFTDHRQREYSDSDYSTLELAMRNRH